MVKFEKSKDSVDVQLRTKVYDKEGHEQFGIIEYDPNTGYGKKIIDAEKGIVRDWYCLGGYIEIDGHTFTADNTDTDKVDAVKEMVDAKVTREKDPKVYDDLLVNYINRHRAISRASKFASETIPPDTLNATASTVYSPDKGRHIARDATSNEVQNT